MWRDKLQKWSTVCRDIRMKTKTCKKDNAEKRNPITIACCSDTVGDGKGLKDDKWLHTLSLMSIDARKEWKGEDQ